MKVRPTVAFPPRLWYNRFMEPAEGSFRGHSEGKGVDDTMTEVYFCFDTEDYTSNTASDAVRDQANILREYGVRGSFNVVGYLAREFVRNRRTDVLDALRAHTVSFHSLRHSFHPTINEYTDVEDYAAARAELERQEAEGMGMVKAACGVDSFPAAVPPGDSLSYVAMYTYADRGIPLYMGSLFNTPDGAGVYYCNGFHTDYNFGMEGLFHRNPDYRLPDFLDKIASMRRVFIYNHPNRVLYEKFWDMVNYRGENKHPMYEWEEAPRYTPAESAHYYQCLCELLAALKADGRFRICTVDELRDRALSDICGRVVTRAQLPAIRASLDRDFRWVTAPVSLSVADIFFAARHFLLHPDAAEYRPGKVHGFLYEPEGVTAPVTLRAGEVRALAEGCDPAAFLPPYFESAGKRIGPADLLFAMLDVCQGAETVTLRPRRQQCAYEGAYPALRDLQLKGTWVHAETFEDRWLSDRLRLQAWTIRPES